MRPGTLAQLRPPSVELSNHHVIAKSWHRKPCGSVGPVNITPPPFELAGAMLVVFVVHGPIVLSARQRISTPGTGNFAPIAVPAALVPTAPKRTSKRGAVSSA